MRGMTCAEVAVLGAVSLLGGCRPGYYYDFYDQTDLILTVPEPGRDFGPLASYGLWPEVIDLSNGVENPIEIDHDRVDPALLEAVEQNMDASGYTKVADPEADEPDIVAIVGVVAQENWYLYSYSYWYYDWYWYYPGYYPPVYAVSYPSGSAIVMLVKPDEATIEDDGSKHAPVIWVAGIWGALSDSATNNIGRAADGVDQAFDQSPYLAQ
jgi:hypothetical protein